MAVVKNMMVRAGADFSAIPREAKKASTSVGNMMSSINQSTSKLSGAIGKLNGIMNLAGIGLSIGAIIGFAKESKSAYDDVVAGETKLTQVMRNTMGASDAEIRSILELTDAQEKLGVVEADAQVAGAQELGTYLQQKSSLEKLIPVMNDMVAQQYGYEATAENCTQIATMMGKVMNGQTGALSRYGYSFTEAQAAILRFGNEEQRAATLASVVEESVGGMNGALAATPTGRLQQVSIAMGNIKESFGKAVTTIGTAFLPLLNTVCAGLERVAALANRVAQAIANVFGGKQAAAAISIASSSMGSLAANTGAASKASEKLQSFGFDQLQKISDSGSDSAGASEETSAEETGTVAGFGVDTSGVSAAADTCTWFETILKRLQETVSKFDTEKISASFGKLKDAVTPLGEQLWSGLKWAYDNVLEPLALWTINDFLPAFMDTLADAISFVSESIEFAAPFLECLWTDFLQPLAAFSGDFIVGILHAIGDTFEWLADVISWLTDGYDVLSQKYDEFCIKGDKFILSIGPWLSNAWTNIGNWLASTVTNIKNWASTAVANVKNCISDFPAWIKRTIIDPAIAKVKGGINGVIGFVEGLVNRVVDALNTVIDRINNFHIDIPDWIPIIGGKSWSPSINSVGYATLPRLANGAVLPGGKPFAAIVNDQKSGVNVESPLSTITDAMIRALEIRDSDATETNVNVVFDGPLAPLARVLRPHIEADAQRAGKRASKVRGTV